MVYESVLLFDLLNNHVKFKEIQKQMMNEGFYFPQEKCYDFVRPINRNDIFVGFIAGDYKGDSCLLHLCYILPKYRGKGIFIEELYQLIKSKGKYNIIINLPNKFLVNTLLKHDLAWKLNNNIIVCEVYLAFYDYDRDWWVVSNYYDLQLCGILDLDACKISPVLSVDIEFFNADFYRDKNIEEYIKELKENVYEDEC